MKFRQLGNSELNVSEIGLGTMSLSTDPNEAARVIDAAFDAGIRFFDTADLYDGGRNEEVVGQALKEKRSDIVLATKVGNKMNPDGHSWVWDPSKEHIINGVKDSLHRLGIDYIDLYQLHGGTIEDPYEETIEAFEQLKKEGIIRAYGISSIRPNVVDRFIENSAIDSVMMQYSLLDRRAELLFPLIGKSGTSVITRGSVAKGLLTKELEKRRKEVDSYVGFDDPALQEALDIIEAIHEDTQALATRFILEEPTVASALIGARTEEQLKEAIRAYEASQSDDVQQAVRYLSIALPRHEYTDHLIPKKD